MTGSQINRFEQTYDVVLQEANTWTGFSGTLLRNTATADYVLSFRSTEYQNENKGGDWTRDGLSGAAGDISTYGFAVAQIADAEAWFRQLQRAGTLPDGARYTVTGYSLGGHLATVFAEAHADDPNFVQAVIFNAPGRAQIDAGQSVKDLVNRAYDVPAADDAFLKTS